MSDPTQAAAAEPTPGPNSYSFTDWIKILHNGAQVQPDHPQYANVRQIMSEALARVAEMHMEQNRADSAAVAPGAIPSAIEGFGQGASFGLAGDPEYLAQAHKYHPIATTGGDILGAGAATTILGAAGAPLMTGLSGLGQTAAAAGTYGALRARAQDENPALGAGIGAGSALLAGGLGKIGGKLLSPLLRKGGAKAVAAAAEGVEPKIGNMTVSEVRASLAKKGWDPVTIEKMIAQNLEKEAGTATPAVRPQSGGVTQEVAPRRAGEVFAPIPGSSGRGFEVTGARATPPIPKTPTITEIQERLAGARASYAQHTAETVLPQPSGGVAITPKGGATVAPADAIPEPFQASRQIAGTIHQLEEKMGRELTRQEKDVVLQKILGAKSSKPGHPLWFGEGSPTPRGPE